MSELLSPQEEDCANEEWPFHISDEYEKRKKRKVKQFQQGCYQVSSAHDVAMSLLHPSPSVLSFKDSCTSHDNLFAFQL